MHTAERRNSKRLPVPHEGAQALVVIGSHEYQAVIADTSSTGLSLLVLRGVAGEISGRMKLVTEDGITECEIIHTRKVESFLHVGIRRLSEVSFEELPRCRKSTRYFRQSLASASPLIFVAVVAGFASVMIGMIIVVDVAAARNRDLAGNEKIHLKAVEDPTGEIRELIEAELIEPSLTPRQLVTAEVNGYLDSAGEALDALQSRHAKMLASVLDGTGMEWDQVSEQIGITPEQQDAIRAALEADPENQTTVLTRARVMSFLNARQRAELAKILAAITPA